MTKRSTHEVIDSHLRCFGERNLEGILSDYAPDAVLFTPEGPLRGVDAIRPLFQAMIAEFGKPGTAFRLTQALSARPLFPHESGRLGQR